MAAEGLGWEDRIGTVEPGKLADITVLHGNPLEDIGAFKDVFMVLKGGTTVVLDGELVEQGVG